MPFAAEERVCPGSDHKDQSLTSKRGQAHRSLEGGRMGHPRAALTTVEHFSFSFPGKPQEGSAQKHSNLSLLQACHVLWRLASHMT